MADDRTARVGQNEALYRIVNERIMKLHPGSAMQEHEFGIVCECASLGCQKQIPIRPEVYEQTRARSDHFIVIPGHQLDDMEKVIEDHGAFIVIEKTPTEAKRLAEEMDPRTQPS